MVLTFDDFKTSLAAWCKDRSKGFKYYFPLKGGWEAWAQADYAAFVIAKDSTIDILREVPVYINTRQRADWLFNNAETDVTKKIVVELKRQSLDNWKNFAAGVGADMEKLDQDNIITQFKTCQTVAMGLYFEPTAQKWMKDHGFTEIYLDDEIGCAIKKMYP